MPDTLAPATLHRVALRARSQPGLLAHLWRSTPAADLLAALACDQPALDRLLLCGVPRPERRDADLAQIAATCGVDRDRLATLLAKTP